MTQRQVLITLLLALPIGTVVLGVAAMVIYFQRGFDQPGGGGPQQASIMHRSVEKSSLEKYVRVLTEDIGDRNTANPKQLEIAAKWLEGTLGPSNMGYRVRRQSYRADEVLCHNLEVELRGGAKENEIIVVGAHYDSVPGTVGANDNGTGVAALLALANAFAGSENQRTLRFVAFVNEEPPFFQTEAMGSRQYVVQCKQRGERIVGMICLETIGYFSDEPGSQDYPEGLEGQFPDTGNFIALVANRPSADLLGAVAEAFQAATDLPCEYGVFPTDVPGISFSDHWSFWQAGYPALMFTDTAPFRYPHYHQPSDTADKVDYDRFLEVVLGVEAAIRALVNPR